jgi:hypothetical protein
MLNESLKYRIYLWRFVPIYCNVLIINVTQYVTYMNIKPAMYE